MAEKEKLLELKNVVYSFHTYGGEVKAVRDVSFEVRKGEILGIVGESGCGKSVTAQCIMRLNPEPPGFFEGGEILFNGKDVLKMDKKELRQLRGGDIGFVFQESSLIQTLNVEENIVLQGSFDSGIYLDRTFLDSLICYLGLENLRHHYPRELSGGERQRVAIARAVYGKTRVIMADEPTANLDSRQSLKAATLLKDCCRTYHQTILMATHNPVIAQVCDRAVHLENGVLTEG